MGNPLLLEKRGGPRRWFEPSVIFEDGGELVAQPHTARLLVESPVPLQLQVIREIERRKRRRQFRRNGRESRHYGSVATRSVSMTMNGTLNTLAVYMAILRRILRRSTNRSRISWLRPSRRITM